MNNESQTISIESILHQATTPWLSFVLAPLGYCFIGLILAIRQQQFQFEATKEILEKWPEAKIIILTSFIDDEKVFPAINAGAKSYILKTASASQIAKAIRDTYNGDGVFEPQVTDKLVNRIQMKQQHFLHEDLTQRELEVLLLIAQGKSNQEIADELFITLKTVKTHVSNILSKLGVEDRTQATIYAFKHQLIKM